VSLSQIARRCADVLAVNRELPASGLVKLTWGNAREIDRDLGLIAIKPSGVAYGTLTATDLIVLDLDGNVVSGAGRPSTDTPTHLRSTAFPSADRHALGP
jgi:L-ribulose-5-phosphate 4-epimerase